MALAGTILHHVTGQSGKHLYYQVGLLMTASSNVQVLV